MSDCSAYYKSISGQSVDAHNDIVNAAVCKGIVPSSVRYDLLNTEFAGIMKGTCGNTYYFQFDPTTLSLDHHAVDAFSAARADHIFAKSAHGFDLIKSIPSDDEEDEEKAMGAPSGGGGQNSGGPGGAVSEEQAMAAQQRLMTEQHPGAAGGQTPDRPEVGRQWHQDTVKSLNFMSEEINKSVESFYPSVSDTEKQFLVEVMGRSPDDVDAGDARMTPIQKVTYQKWLAKSVNNDYKTLTGWLAKRA